MAEDTPPVTPMVEDLLRMFRASTIRGEKVSLHLESRRGITTATFKCEERSAGVQAVPITQPSKPEKKKRSTPAQVRRSQTRLELFLKKKEEEKKRKEKEEVEREKLLIGSESADHPLSTPSPVADDKTKFKCERCNFNSEDEPTFTEHKREKHRIFECEHCEYKSSSEYTLRKHKRNIHSKKCLLMGAHECGPVECEFCDPSYSYYWTCTRLKEHMEGPEDHKKETR